MSESVTATGVVVREPGEGPATWAMGSLFEHLLTAEESGGGLGAALVTQPPGIATPLHRHTRESEAFFLLEGTMTGRRRKPRAREGSGGGAWDGPCMPRRDRSR